MHTKILLLGFVIGSLILPLSAQEPWEDDLQNFPDGVFLAAPSGYRTHAAPGAAATGTVPGVVRIEVSGFVEAGGQRYYMTASSRDAWIKTQAAPVWISTDGSGELPPLPRLLKRGEGEDPDSGEMVMIEAYEETVAIQPESLWPGTAANPEKYFPAALIAVGEDPAGNTTADFQLFLHGDGMTTGYPFAMPSFRQIMSGVPHPVIRLYSKPDRANIRLTIAGPSTVLPLLQPGLVFRAGFADGQLVQLSLGGDAWSESAAISRLGAPVFRRDERLVLGFTATEVTGPGVPLRVLPDRIGGADYTEYRLIGEMGPPFDDLNPIEYQDGWTLHIERDLTLTALAPLYDGRGAPGMLELEGLELEPALPAPSVDNFTDEQYAAFRGKLTVKTDPSIFGQGWQSITASKLGEVPASQRIAETPPAEF